MDYGSIIKYTNGRFGRCYRNSGFYNSITDWLGWYNGHLKAFHNVRVSNGKTTRTRTLYSANMAKRVCEDWSSAMLSEDIKVVVNSTNNKSSVFVQGSKGNGGVLGSNNFSEEFSKTLEYMFALGTSALTIELDNISVDEYGNIVDGSNAKIRISSYNATRIVPISWRNGIIHEAAFLSEITITDKTYYIVASHIKEEDGYVIYSDILDSTYNKVNQDIGLLPVIRTKSQSPLFYIMRTNIANNIDLDSPMGVSIYSNAINALKGCDIVYDSCIRDVETGQRIMLFPTNLLPTDEKGKAITPFDIKADIAQYYGDDVEMEGKELIKVITPDLNTEKLNKGMQLHLNMLSNKVGLGVNYYNFDSTTGAITATEYVGQRNDFMRNAVKMSRTLSNCLKSLVLGILFVGKNILGANVDENAKVDIVMPDGVVEDDNKQREQDRQDVKDGIMSKAEYRAKWYGETLETAQKKINAIDTPSDT